MRSHEGFAMADTLLALTILSVFAVSIIGMNTNSTSALQKSNARLSATLLAKSILSDRSIRGTQGEVEIGPRLYRWHKKVTPRNISSQLHPRLNDVTISINWEMRNRTYSYNIEAIELK